MYCLMAAHVYIDLWKETGECLRLSFQSSSCFSSHVSYGFGSVCFRRRGHGVAGFGCPAGGPVSQPLQRPVQTAAAAPLLSPGSLWACSWPLFQPGRQACTARHHRVSTWTPLPGAWHYEHNGFGLLEGLRVAITSHLPSCEIDIKLTWQLLLLLSSRTRDLISFGSVHIDSTLIPIRWVPQQLGCGV